MTVDTWHPDDAQPEPVRLTPAAVAHVRNQIAQQPSAVGIRLGTRKSGCSGFMYQLDFVEQPDAEDTVFETDDVRVFVDADSLKLVGGTTIDYVQDGISRVMRFNNPHAQDTCGCGESFSVS
ncbi:MAG: iron-sulfur cluster assembly accessory protein [Pseudomonadota bacterium]